MWGESEGEGCVGGESEGEGCVGGRSEGEGCVGKGVRLRDGRGRERWFIYVRMSMCIPK